MLLEVKNLILSLNKMSSLNIHQEKLKFYSTIVSYFGDALMTKVKEFPPTSPTSGTFSVYYSKLGCLLCINDRYIACIVKNDPHPIGNQKHLSDMRWVSFQTRTIEHLPMKLASQTLKTTVPDGIRDKIILQEKLGDRCVYYAQNAPIKVELLYDKDNHIYSETGTVQSALDTYNCSISFLI